MATISTMYSACAFLTPKEAICPQCILSLQPSNEAELCNAVATAVSINDRPSCFRFPRGNGLGVDLASFGVTPGLKARLRKNPKP